MTYVLVYIVVGIIVWATWLRGILSPAIRKSCQQSRAAGHNPPMWMKLAAVVGAVILWPLFALILGYYKLRSM